MQRGPLEASPGVDRCVCVEETRDDLVVACARRHEQVAACGGRLRYQRRPGPEAELARELDERSGERLGLAARYEQAGFAVDDELAEAADLRGDDRPGALHRLERDHPEAFAERRHDDDRARVDRVGDR